MLEERRSPLSRDREGPDGARLGPIRAPDDPPVRRPVGETTGVGTRGPRFVGMRWWLGVAFALVAALTAVAVVSLLSSRSENAFRRYGKEFAVGNAVSASEALQAQRTPAGVARRAVLIAERQHLAVFVFDAHGRLLSGPTSFGIRWNKVPRGQRALTTALSGLRYIEGRRDGSAFTVALPIHRGAGTALVAYSLRPELRAQLGIVRNEYLQSALIAFGAAAALGLVIATFTARRLSRLAAAAREIGAGNFGGSVVSRFPDEVGSLALSIEQMRRQLQTLFGALETDRDRLELLLDRLNEGVLVVDADLNVEFANERAHELVGPARNLRETGSDAPVRVAELERIVRSLFELRLPSHARIEQGDQTFLVSGIPPNEGGETAIIVVSDESQQERNNRVQREFATNAAHELRTPLASIVTAAEMLQTGAKDDPEARDEFIEVIARQADRLTRLTRALLTLARAEARDEPPRLNPVSVAPLLGQVAQTLAPRDHVGIRVECVPSVVALADPDLLEQAIANVAANAVQHTVEGTVTLRARRDNGTVLIEVIDTGSGIASQDKGRLFDRFFRVGDQVDGFGLGLSIAHDAVAALGGEIAVESEKATGTTVQITLPSATTDE